jgi:DNA repair protein RadC
MERLRRYGADMLSNAELLSLATGVSVATADEHLRALDGVKGMFRAGIGELAAIVGVDNAARIVALAELYRVAQSEMLQRPNGYQSSRDVVSAFQARIGNAVDESVIAVILDSRQRPIAERVIAKGGPASCAVSVRDVFALAVREGGSGVIVVHNHPSGDPSPSADDVVLTNALREAGDVLGIPLADHVIIAAKRSFSFLDAGLLKP